MLDQKPIPRYLMGFPTEIQATILRTVESQLKELIEDKKIPQEVAESFTGKELDELREICKKEKITYIGYQPRLAHYLIALQPKDN